MLMVAVVAAVVAERGGGCGGAAVCSIPFYRILRRNGSCWKVDALIVLQLDTPLL